MNNKGIKIQIFGMCLLLIANYIVAIGSNTDEVISLVFFVLGLILSIVGLFTKNT